MIIDATFWVAISFFIFIAALVYLKVPNEGFVVCGYCDIKFAKS